MDQDGGCLFNFPVVIDTISKALSHDTVTLATVASTNAQCPNGALNNAFYNVKDAFSTPEDDMGDQIDVCNTMWS